MKRLLSLLPVVLLSMALGVAGCAQVQKTIEVVTTPFTNPVSPTNLYQGKVVFAASQDLVLKYQADCFGSQFPPYPVTVKKIKADPVLAVQCKRRVSRYNAMKAAEDKANYAIVAADKFITENPTGNAGSYIAAALQAVVAYRATVGG